MPLGRCGFQHSYRVRILASRRYQALFGVSARKCIISAVADSPRRKTSYISPIEMCPVRENTSLYVGDMASATTTSTANETGGDPISKMVDYAMTLKLDANSQSIIRKAWNTMLDNEMTLNQTLGDMARHPLTYNIEVKKQNQTRDPRVQLAIWDSAELKKKQHHGWDISMPMPAIVVSGHDWYYYIFYEHDSQMVCVTNIIKLLCSCFPQAMSGPFPFGSTINRVGMWTILRRLAILNQWSATTYKQWFKDHILTWMQNRDNTFAATASTEEHST